MSGCPWTRSPPLRLARDGEAAGPIRHQCSGFHAASILLSRFSDWTLEDYDRPEHPSQFAVRTTVAQLFGVDVDELETAQDDCGLATYAFPLVDIARAYALLADPASAPDATRAAMAPALTRIRDAMTGAPEMVGGTEGSMDTMLMQHLRGKVVSKGGAEGLRGIGLLPGARGTGRPAAGLVVRIDDGDGFGRANRAVTMEALRQLGVVDERARRALADQHRPVVPVARRAMSSRRPSPGSSWPPSPSWARRHRCERHAWSAPIRTGSWVCPAARPTSRSRQPIGGWPSGSTRTALTVTRSDSSRSRRRTCCCRIPTPSPGLGYAPRTGTGPGERTPACATPIDRAAAGSSGVRWRTGCATREPIRWTAPDCRSARDRWSSPRLGTAWQPATGYRSQ